MPTRNGRPLTWSPFTAVQRIQEVPRALQSRARLGKAATDPHQELVVRDGKPHRRKRSRRRRQARLDPLPEIRHRIGRGVRLRKAKCRGNPTPSRRSAQTSPACFGAHSRPLQAVPASSTTSTPPPPPSPASGPLRDALEPEVQRGKIAFRCYVHLHKDAAQGGPEACHVFSTASASHRPTRGAACPPRAPASPRARESASGSSRATDSLEDALPTVAAVGRPAGGHGGGGGVAKPLAGTAATASPLDSAPDASARIVAP